MGAWRGRTEATARWSDMEASSMVADNKEDDPISPRAPRKQQQQQQLQQGPTLEMGEEEDEEDDEEDGTENEVESNMEAGELDSMLEAALKVGPNLR